MGSLTPVTVTVCGVLQVTFVNVRDEVDTVPSAVSRLWMGMITSAEGCELRRTVKVAVPPLSVVGLDAGLPVTPAASLSLIVSVTGVDVETVYDADDARVRITVSGPSATKSS